MEPFEERTVADQRHFHGLGDARTAIARRQGVEPLIVVDHGKGRREGAEEVLASVPVDRVLDSDARVVLGENRGGHANQAETAVGGGGCEAHRIEDRAPADREHEGVATQTVPLDAFVDLFHLARIVLAHLATTDLERGIHQLDHVPVGVGVAFESGRQIRCLLEHTGVDDREHPVAFGPGPAQQVAQGRVTRFEGSPGEDHGVREAQSEILGDLSHRSLHRPDGIRIVAEFCPGTYRNFEKSGVRFSAKASRPSFASPVFPKTSRPAKASLP
jgi:hypothetical protein